MAEPRIIRHNWGTITCNHRGKVLTFKDCILTPNSATEWDWTVDGTKHQPGITRCAVQQFEDCDHIVLSRGVNMELHVTPEAVNFLSQRKIQIYILQTDNAVLQYNYLVQIGHRVGALIHTTC